MSNRISVLSEIRALLNAGSLVVIMRGVPGCGKSTLAKELLKLHQQKAYCSADDFYIGKDGVYRFDPRKINDAHLSCFDRFLGATSYGYRLIVVDNTNTKAWEIAPYFQVARVFGYDVCIVDLGLPHFSSIHGVKPDDLERMKKNYQEEVLPPHFQKKLLKVELIDGSWFLRSVERE